MPLSTRTAGVPGEAEAGVATRIQPGTGARLLPREDDPRPAPNAAGRPVHAAARRHAEHGAHTRLPISSAMPHTTIIQHPTESDTVPRPWQTQDRVVHKRKYSQQDPLSQQSSISHPAALSRQPAKVPNMSHPVIRPSGHGRGHGHPRTLESLDITDFTATSSQPLRRGSIGHITGSLSQHGGSLNLADRRKATLSQLSRRFALPPSAPRPGGSSRSLQHRSQLPVAAPISSSQLNTPLQPPSGLQHSGPVDKSSTSLMSAAPPLAPTPTQNSLRGRTASELAKTIVLPPTAILSTQQGKKKMKFTPPIVSNGYTAKFIQFFTKESFEHRMWATVHHRRVKVFEDSVPEVVVEVISLFRDHNILLSKCRVLSPANLRADCPPRRELSLESLYVVPKSPSLELLDADLSELKETFVGRDDTHSSVEDLSMMGHDSSSSDREFKNEKPLTLECVQDSTNTHPRQLPEPHNPDDSIAGLHTELQQLAFLASSQGSELGTQPLARRRILEELEHFDPSMLASQLAIGAAAAPIYAVGRNSKDTVMPSSQGSDDDLSDVDRDWQHARHLRFQADSPSTDVDVLSPTCASPELVSGSTDTAPHAIDSMAKWDESMWLPEKASDAMEEPILQHEKAIEVIDLESDAISTDNPRKAPLKDTLSRADTIETIPSTASSPSAGPDVHWRKLEPLKESHFTQLRGSTEQEADDVRYIYVLFSNAFQWLTLKVTDRVEIHAPFREIRLQDSQMEASSGLPFSHAHQSIWVADRYRVIPPDST